MAGSQEIMLDWVYRWEETDPDSRWAVQPMGKGRIEELTWRRAMTEARKVAAYLKTLDLPPGSHIGLASKNSAWWILADLAIWMAGHVSVPVYPTLTRNSVRQILEHAGVKAAFVGKLDDPAEIRAGIPEGVPRIALPLSNRVEGELQWSDILTKHQPLQGKIKREPEELATIIYTSGSTGTPKGAMHSFRGMADSARGVLELVSVSRKDRMLSYLPLAHVYERLVVESCGLAAGGEMYFAESLETFMDDMRRARPTVFVSVPRLWQKFHGGVVAKMPSKRLELLLKIPLVNSYIRKRVLTQLGLEHCRYANSGSAPIPPQLLQWYRDLGLELSEGYGMTENFGYSHGTRPGRGRVGYVGEPQPGCQHRISPEGEVQVKSPGMMMGYYNAPELTKETFTEDGWQKTGDRGEIDSENRLKITGRVKELFKTSKGKYVAPAPIENKLLVNDAVESACVLGAGQEQPMALVVLSEGARAKAKNGAKTEVAAELDAHLQKVNAELDPHEQLKYLVVSSEPWTIESGLLTPTLKVKRGPLEDKYRNRIEQFYQSKSKVIWEDDAV